MTRKIALLAFALAALSVVGFGIGTSRASAAPGLQAYTGGPYAGIAGSAIQFDGTASSGIGLSYVWTFGDGTSAVGARPVKSYSAPGVYRVTLTVQDFTGAQAVAATTATISGFRNLVPGNCAINGIGQVICGTTITSIAAGCYLSVVGWICPGTVPGQVIAPGFVTSTALLTASSTCAHPSYARTPLCLQLR